MIEITVSMKSSAEHIEVGFDSAAFKAIPFHVGMNVISDQIDASFKEERIGDQIGFDYIQTVDRNKEYYQGDYEITPKITEQKMHTKDKTMLQDVKIKQIPFYQVSNDSGDTVYIGREVEVYGN